MIITIGDNNFKQNNSLKFCSNDSIYVLKSICDLKKVKEQEVVLIVDGNNDYKNVINDDIVIDELFISKTIILLIICNTENEYLKDCCKKYGTKYIQISI